MQTIVAHVMNRYKIGYLTTTDGMVLYSREYFSTIYLLNFVSYYFTRLICALLFATFIDSGLIEGKAWPRW